MNNITCDQFRYLFQIYTIDYICSNSNIYCDNYCMNHNDCYCFCNNNNIYCVNRYYYAWKFFSVILTTFLFAFVCTYCYNLVKRQRNKSAINYYSSLPPPYTINKNTEKS
jgi:hypothetical protein